MTWVWPYKTFADLTAAGYIFRNASKCSGKDCGREIYWFKSPKGCFMAVDVVDFKPHWSVCPNAEDFKKNEKPNAKEGESARPSRGLRKPSNQANLFDD